jgi:hypothetical protein
MALNVVVYLDVLWTWLQDLFVNPAAGDFRRFDRAAWIGARCDQGA